MVDQGQRIQLVLPQVLRATMQDTVLGAGMSALMALLEEERTELCGPRYAHDAERHATRAGYAKSDGLANQLERPHPQAAAALREGLDETLTVTRMALPDWLERTLATTNAIENLNGSLRRITKRVKRWDDGTMVLRWVAASLTEASKGFRKLRGYKGMPKLLAALRTHDAALGITIDDQEKAA